MCKFIKPKKLTFENKIGLSPKRKIKPLFFGKVERPENLQFDIMKYEFSKPYVQLVQIKTEYQNAVEVKTDCVSDCVTEATEIMQCLTVDKQDTELDVDWTDYNDNWKLTFSKIFWFDL